MMTVKRLGLFLLCACAGLFCHSNLFAKSVAMEHDGVPGCSSPDDMGLSVVGGGVTETFDLYFYDLNPVYSVNCTFCIQDASNVDLSSANYTSNIAPPWTITPMRQADPMTEVDPAIVDAYPNLACWLVQATDFTFTTPWPGGKHGTFQFTTTGETCIGFVMDGNPLHTGVFFTDFTSSGFDGPGERCGPFFCGGLLPAPTGLSASTDSCWGVFLSWDPLPGADSFAVSRSIDAWYTTDLFFRDSSATGTATYYVAGINADGPGDSSQAIGSRGNPPAAPSGLSASDDSCGVIRIIWNPPANADSFRIFRDGGLIGAVPSPMLFFRDTSSGPGTYAYSATALNTCGESSPSAPNQGTRLADPPAIPAGLSASNDRCDGIVLTWADVSGEDGYYLYREGAIIDTLAANATSRLDGSVPAGYQVQYNIAAFNTCEPNPGLSSGASGYRNLPAPDPVTGLSATTALCSGIELSWADVEREDGYAVERDGVPIDTVAPGQTGYLDALAMYGGVYSYRVGPFNDCSASPVYGPTAVGERAGPPAAAPAVLTASDTSNTIVRLDWVASPQADGYRIFRDNSPIDTVSSGTLFYEDSPGPGSYLYGVAAGNICGWSDSTVAIGTVLPGDSNCTLEVCDYSVTEDFYSILIMSATLDSLPLEPGDEIWVMDDSICVGMAVWTGTTPLGLTAWEDDPQTAWVDGFTCGNDMSFQVLDQSECKVCKLTETNYIVGDGTFCNGPYSQVEFSFRCTETQCVEMNSGWNWMSLRVNPEPVCDSLDMIFSWCKPVLDIVKARDGSFFVPDVYDGIGCLDSLGGYSVHQSDTCTVCVEGVPIAVDTPIPLSDGWNWVPFLPDRCSTPDSLLQGIWNCMNIVKARDGSFCIPDLYCGIAAMCPGQHYRIHATESCTLQYQVPAAGTRPAAFSARSAKEPVHFRPVPESNEYDALLIESAQLDGHALEVGDEIAVYARGLCVGALAWDGALPTALAAWMDNPRTERIDGYRAGQKMTFRIWDRSTNTELRANAAFLGGDNAFGTDPYVVVKLNAKKMRAEPAKTEGATAQLPIRYMLWPNRPNPTSGRTMFHFALPEPSMVHLRIYNTSGRLVRELGGFTMGGGFHTIEWDGRDGRGREAPAGVYYYRFESDGLDATKKLVLIR